MRDILNRPLNDYDLVVVKATGRHSRMDIGIKIGKSVTFNGGSKASYNECYKLENPTEEELNIKYKIMNAIEKKEEKLKSKVIPIKLLKPGYLYEDNTGYKYIYLGKMEYEYVDFNNNKNNKHIIGYGITSRESCRWISILKNLKFIKEIEDKNIEKLKPKINELNEETKNNWKHYKETYRIINEAQKNNFRKL